MIFVVGWPVFHMRTGGCNIYVDEYDDRWEMYAVMTSAEVLKCVMRKSDNTERNIMFVDKHLMDNRNVVKVMGVERNSMLLKVEQAEDDEKRAVSVPLDLESE